MSRIGKQLIALPEKFTCAVTDNTLTVTGPLGTLQRAWDRRFSLVPVDGAVTVKPSKINLETNTLWGTYASHLQNMVRGVSLGFQKQLTIEGVGYKVNLTG